MAILTPNEAAARHIVTAIITDLTGRSGLENEWDNLTEDTRAEVIKQWRKLAKTVLDKQRGV